MSRQAPAIEFTWQLANSNGGISVCTVIAERAAMDKCQIIPLGHRAPSWHDPNNDDQNAARRAFCWIHRGAVSAYLDGGWPVRIPPHAGRHQPESGFRAPAGGRSDSPAADVQFQLLGCVRELIGCAAGIK